MRRFFVLALLFVAAPVLAGEGVKVTAYGEKLSDTEIVPISKLMAEPDAFVGKTVKVSGRVLGVCAKRGCWMELAGDEEFQSMRIKVEDGVIVFPMDAVGSQAVAEGVFTKIALSQEQTHAMPGHKCAEAEGEAHDAAKSCTPTSLYQIAGVGAEISTVVQ